MKRRSALGSLVVALCLFCVLVACKRKHEEASPETRRRFAQLEPLVRQRLTAIAALAPRVAEASGVDQPLENRAAVVEIIGAAWLEDPSRRANAEEEVDLSSTLLSLCKGYLTKQGVTSEDVQYLERCSKIEYVAVVRTRTFDKPQVDMRAKSYDPGKFAGDVLVYSLPKGELSAKYSVEATNSEELELDERSNVEGNWYRLAIDDLSRNAKSAVLSALIARPSSDGSP